MGLVNSEGSSAELEAFFAPLMTSRLPPELDVPGVSAILEFDGLLTKLLSTPIASVPHFRKE
jgi:hypothetical protein